MNSTLVQLGYHYHRAGLLEVPKVILRHIVHGSFYRYNRRKLTSRPGVPRVTTVDPEELTFSTIPKPWFPHKGADTFLGEVGGIWDRFRTEFESTTIYQSLYKRFEEGCRWEETALYRSARWSLEQRSGSSVEQLEKRCDSIDELYEDIKTNGYSKATMPIRRVEEGDQATGTDDAVRVGEFLIPDEPRVGIGHDGTCIRLGGGRHRISIAKLLGIEEIPVVVLVEHTGWDPSD